MPTAVVANSMGTPQPDNGSEPIVQKPGQKGQKPGVPAGKSGGEITLSRAEAAALLVFETEDEKGSMKRAQEWSACSRCRLCLLRRLSATPPARRRQRWTSISKSWSGGGRTIFGFRSAATFAGGVRWRASDSHLVWCRDDQTTIPALDVLDLKERCDSLEQRRPPGLRKPNQQTTVPRSARTDTSRVGRFSSSLILIARGLRRRADPLAQMPPRRRWPRGRPGL